MATSSKNQPSFQAARNVMRGFQTRIPRRSTEKSFLGRRRHGLQVEQGEEVNGSELPVQCGRAADFGSESKVGAEQFRNFYFFIRQPVERALKLRPRAGLPRGRGKIFFAAHFRV